MRGSRARRILLAIGVALLCTTRCAGELGPAELECELAANQLANCCAGFVPTSVNCGSTGCDTSEPWAQGLLGGDAGACIIGESCSTLVSTNVCGRAAAILGYSDERMPDGDADAGTQVGGLCP
jgi:hypothetical protein